MGKQSSKIGYGSKGNGDIQEEKTGPLGQMLEKHRNRQEKKNFRHVMSRASENNFCQVLVGEARF